MCFIFENKLVSNLNILTTEPLVELMIYLINNTLLFSSVFLNYFMNKLAGSDYSLVHTTNFFPRSGHCHALKGSTAVETEIEFIVYQF